MTVSRISAAELRDLLLLNNRPSPARLGGTDGEGEVEVEVGVDEGLGSASGSGVAVIDVRDDDYIGGHILQSIHIPSTTFETHLPALVDRLKEKEVVVFHCALSQQRGPRAAARYLRERERLEKLGGLGEGQKGLGEFEEESGNGRGENSSGAGRKAGLLGGKRREGRTEEVDHSKDDMEESQRSNEEKENTKGNAKHDSEWVDLQHPPSTQTPSQDANPEMNPNPTSNPGPRAQRVLVLERGFVGWQEVYGEDKALTEGYSRELWRDGYWM